MSQRSSYTEGTPCWVDLLTTDVDAAKAFYAKLFSWSFDDMPNPGGGVYSMALFNGETVAAVAPQSPEMVEHQVPPMWNTYIAVDDVDAAFAKALAAGGQSMMEPFDVTEAGRMAWVADPTGAAVGLWQAGRHIGATLVNEPNALVWNELVSSDLETALPFYEAVLGITAREMPMGEDTYLVLHVGEGMVGGAMTPQAAGEPNHWRVWFAVADTDEAVATTTSAGGALLFGPLDMPVGRFAVLADPQGAAFTVIKMNPAP